MKHTKGPWNATLKPRINVKGPDKKSICALIMAAGANNKPYDEVCSNARLISAAPDLLQALKGIVEWIEDSGNAEYAGTSNMEACYTAISKAEGET